MLQSNKGNLYKSFKSTLILENYFEILPFIDYWSKQIGGPRWKKEPVKFKPLFILQRLRNKLYNLY